MIERNHEREQAYREKLAAFKKTAHVNTQPAQTANNPDLARGDSNNNMQSNHCTDSLDLARGEGVNNNQSAETRNDPDNSGTQRVNNVPSFDTTTSHQVNVGMGDGLHVGLPTTDQIGPNNSQHDSGNCAEVRNSEGVQNVHISDSVKMEITKNVPDQIPVQESSPNPRTVSQADTNSEQKLLKSMDQNDGGNSVNPVPYGVQETKPSRISTGASSNNNAKSLKPDHFKSKYLGNIHSWSIPVGVLGIALAVILFIHKK